MNTLKERIADLERRQVKEWNKDRAWQLEKLKIALDGKLDKLINIAHSGKFAANTGRSMIEALFAQKSVEAGWKISKRGWPDFFMWKDGKLACVEVKGDLEPLRLNQKAVLEGLASYGVPCFTWRPLEGFKKITGEHAIAAIGEAIKHGS